MARADLLALTEDGLIQLANAGLVKRAAREVTAGLGPTLDEAADGTIEARFADGTLTRLPPAAAAAAATCTCPASGLCRHRVALVLAYKAKAHAASPAAPPAATAAWDPATLDLEAFEAALGASAKAELKRLVAAGAKVELERGAVPVARLPTTTVRFLVPAAIAYARCDCAAGAGCAHVALAVRAFRAAAGADAVRLGAGTTAAPDDDLKRAVDALIVGLLERGVVAGPAAHVDTLARLRRLAETRGATQLRLAVTEMEEQIAAYAARDARYDERAVLALAVELDARVRVGDRATLGIGQPYETAMGKTRLVSLGARLRTRGRDVVAGLALADTDTGVALLVERTFAPPEGKADDFAASLPTRQLATGLQLTAAARGQILTSVAKRRADGLLVLGSGARGRTALLPRDATLRLPASLAAADAGVVARGLAERPPSFLAPRDRLGAMRVFAAADVLGQAWSPGSQVWQAAVRLEGEGGTLFLARAYDSGAPGALDALAAAFDGGDGPVRQIAGEVRIVGGVLVCDPWSVAADRLVVPDVEPLIARAQAPAWPTGEAASPVEAGQALLAGALHAGRRSTAGGAAQKLAATLDDAGHRVAAERLGAWLTAPVGGADAFSAAALWFAAVMEDSAPPADE